MNKILTLYDIEFKRIYKLYFALLGLLLIGNIGAVFMCLYSVVSVVAVETKAKATLDLLKSPIAHQMIVDSGLEGVQGWTTILLGFAVILCLIYAIVIWYRDFIGKSKTVYTLFMLPENKFKIYISKAITLIVMIYGVMITQMISWVIDINIIKVLSNINMIQMWERLEYNVLSSRTLNLIQPYITDFLMVNVIGVILAVIVIFTGIMIQKSFGKVGVILGVIYILASIAGYIYLVRYGVYSDQLFIRHVIYYLVSFIVSIGLSYTLLNKKVYV